jgi:hypothetical protein
VNNIQRDILKLLSCQQRGICSQLCTPSKSSLRKQMLRLKYKQIWLQLCLCMFPQDRMLALRWRFHNSGQQGKLCSLLLMLPVSLICKFLRDNESTCNRRYWRGSNNRSDICIVCKIPQDSNSLQNNFNNQPEKNFPLLDYIFLRCKAFVWDGLCRHHNSIRAHIKSFSLMLLLCLFLQDKHSQLDKSHSC